MNQKETNCREVHCEEQEDRVLALSRAAIRHAVRLLAVLMVFVIWWGVADVIYVLYSRISAHPLHLLEIRDIFATFGAFMAVLIAVEVFANIVSYLKDEGLQLEIVMATAYMAVLRKIVILDYKEVSPEYVYATAALALSLAIGYWVTVKYPCGVPLAPGKKDMPPE
ncbi:Uncharacterized membrane protein, DUF373 family [Formivibrio citricus]|uniref:Uncharacterized membrane protein, DUF373 family n=1 Tax=Formivibrio citricus TaxID=83765 RepID=A0A1I5A1P8_9NEIS|nr:phosphate-starvation-inducible PsiE family protein [Formivibrio citricus]SFN56189.1 Uncharacterized membrane protein, DUF373 family [Formivibrio citricus]